MSRRAASVNLDDATITAIRVIIREEVGLMKTDMDSQLGEVRAELESLKTSIHTEVTSKLTELNNGLKAKIDELEEGMNFISHQVDDVLSNTVPAISTQLTDLITSLSIVMLQDQVHDR